MVGNHESVSSLSSGTIATAPAVSPETIDRIETPASIVEAMVMLAGIESTHLCLEPSAGAGALARAMGDVVGRPRVHVCELDWRLADALRDQGFGFCVQGDWCAMRDPLAAYDRILMHPPASEDDGVAHVSHALDYLAPGGRLLAVLPMDFVEGTSRAHKRLAKALADYRVSTFTLPSEAFGIPARGFCLLIVDDLRLEKAAS